jgi:hypothetical protein
VKRTCGTTASKKKTIKRVSLHIKIFYANKVSELKEQKAIFSYKMN